MKVDFVVNIWVYLMWLIVLNILFFTYEFKKNTGLIIFLARNL